MAIVAVNHAEFNSPNNNGGTTPNVDMTGATLLIAGSEYYDGAGGTSAVSDSLSNTWAQLTKSTVSNANCSIWYVENPTVGSTQNFTASGTNSFPSLQAAGFSGTAVASVFDNQTGSTTTATSISNILTPSADGELVISVVSVRLNPDNITGTPSGFTVSDQNNGDGATNSSCGTAYLLSSSGSATAQWTVASSSALAHRMASFKAAGGGGGGLVIPVAMAQYRQRWN